MSSNRLSLPYYCDCIHSTFGTLHTGTDRRDLFTILGAKFPQEGYDTHRATIPPFPTLVKTSPRVFAEPRNATALTLSPWSTDRKTPKHPDYYIPRRKEAKRLNNQDVAASAISPCRDPRHGHQLSCAPHSRAQPVSYVQVPLHASAVTKQFVLVQSLGDV